MQIIDTKMEKYCKNKGKFKSLSSRSKISVNFSFELFARRLLWTFLPHFLLIFYLIFSFQPFQSAIALYTKFDSFVVKRVLTLWTFFLWGKLNCLLVFVVLLFRWSLGSFSRWILIGFMGWFSNNGIYWRLLVLVWNGYWLVSGSLWFDFIKAFVFGFVGSGFFGWFLL